MKKSKHYSAANNKKQKASTTQVFRYLALHAADDFIRILLPRW